MCTIFDDMFLASNYLHILYTPALVLSAYHLVYVSSSENEFLFNYVYKMIARSARIKCFGDWKLKSFWGFDPYPTGGREEGLQRPSAPPAAFFVCFANSNIRLASLGTFQIFFPSSTLMAD